MPSNAILFDISRGIARLTFNIPEKHNALGPAELASVHDALDEVTANRDIRALIVTGSGHRTFCAGANLDAMGSGDIDGNLFTDMTQKLASLPVPTLCSFNGSAYGGGTEIGLACDLRIGTDAMRLFVPPARIGLCYPVRGIQRFVATLGIDTTKRLLLFGEEMTGQDLYRLRYLTHLTNVNEREALTEELATRAASYSPTALRAMKAISNACSLNSVDQEWAERIARECNNSADLKEGLLARAEKRAPVFQG